MTITLSVGHNIIIPLTMFQLILMIYLLPVMIIAVLLIRFIRWLLSLALRFTRWAVPRIFRLALWLLVLGWYGGLFLWRYCFSRTAP
ncbi:hypothetical protein [Bacteroides acidifaciens]|uniref:hypothetical protein n=1 Tax=Bacteroides acidifaciens TaxID=85831 RepID=UPI0025AE268B|nr:hypothetical protein [Bacteroides acidifaciens]